MSSLVTKSLIFLLYLFVLSESYIVLMLSHDNIVRPQGHIINKDVKTRE